jgi:hypothetical protein
MFQQIDLMLTSKNIPQELPEMSQQFAKELERMADNYDDSDPNNDENGGWFTFHPNMNRTEVRVFATAQENNRVSTIEDIESIIKGICRKDDPVCPLYHERLKEKEKENTNTSLKEKEMSLFHSKTSGGAKCIYEKGYAKRGTVNAQGIGGGGNLPLDK